MRKFLTLVFNIILSSAFGQVDGVWIHPNRGQWHETILYKIELNNGEMYLEKDGFTFALNDFKSQMSHKHHEGHEDESKEKIKAETILESKIIHSQIIRSKFFTSSWSGEVVEQNASSHYRNYFIGNDQSKWKSNLKSYHSVQLKNFYPKIDLVVNGESDNLKYSFVVQANTPINQIQYVVTGANSISIDEKGNLRIQNDFGEIIEESPIAWNIIDGEKKEVNVKFELINDTISFVFPQGFDTTSVLVIDPSLTFSTFSGSTADNWGMTATPDSQGNLCAGGIVFNDGGVYPATTGAFNTKINGGENYSSAPGSIHFGFDIAISKFNTTGTALIYATYIGGSSNEAPHSLVSGDADELYIMGVTSSQNFPVTSGAFDESYNRGPDILENGLYYSGSDIFVSKLSANGSQMLGSTYVGGSGSDGINTGALNYNFGDPFRGEIINGENGFIYVSSTTQSTDFPTINAAQNNLSGTQDAVIFKLNSSLTSMEWSTYFGGNGLETGNSIQKSSAGEIYIAGGTNSSNLVFPIGEDLTFNGGSSDGYLLRLNENSGTTIGGTYMGLGEYDQAYFVQIDLNNDVFVFGQTESNWPITSGKYGNANSGQFVRKYDQNLTSIKWTTMIGAGTGNPEISPTAFLVSNCNDIYIAGWGGSINVQASAQAHFSTTKGFPTTNDAFQKTTSGSNFYLAVLGHDATLLKYGTFMGGVNGSSNHVDGGTSRFDKSGSVYHAVCAACGGNPNGFTTTPGVYSSQNRSSNCNLAGFKFALNNDAAIIGTTDSVVCLPNKIVFRNSVSNGNSFFWDFGDGYTSRQVNPTHTYTQPGSYTIKLTFQDTVLCFFKDSTLFKVRLADFSPNYVAPLSTICANTPFQLNASGGFNYKWTPVNVLDNPTSASPTATVDTTTQFKVIISDVCGIDSFLVNLPVYSVNTRISNDTLICEGQNTPVFATGGVSYSWSPTTFLTNPLSQNPTCISPIQTTTYIAQITTSDGCVVLDSTKINVHTKPPIPLITDSTVCIQNLTTFSNASAVGTKYIWDFGDNSFSTVPNPTHSYQLPGAYTIKVVFSDTAMCYSKDSTFFNITINKFQGGIASMPTTICPNNSFQLEAFGGTNYLWTPAISIDSNTSRKPIAIIDATTNFTVKISDECGMADFNFTLGVFDLVSTISKDTSICIGGSASLIATGGSIYLWSPITYLNDPTLENPLATSEQTTTYSVKIETIEGCLLLDSTKVTVFYTAPIPILIDSLLMCYYNSLTVVADGAEKYRWTPDVSINTLVGTTVTVNPKNDTTYYCEFKNACGITNDSVFIDVLHPIIKTTDTIICLNQSVLLSATGAVNYNWFLNSLFIDSTKTNLLIYPLKEDTYTVIGSDAFNCLDTAEMLVSFFPKATIRAIPTVYAFLGDEVQLNVSNDSIGSYLWSPQEYLSCSECPNPIATPNKNTTYTIYYTNENGCSADDKVKLIYDGLIYVPNTFTPESRYNPIFKAVGGNIKNFHLDIYNRWGRLIFTSDDFEIGWDGTYNGVNCQVGTYTWEILYTDYSSNAIQKIIGHINLVR